MKKLFLLLAVASSPAIAASGGSDLKWSVGASANLEGQYFPEAYSPRVEQKFGILDAELNGSVKSGRTFLAKARPTAHWDPNNPTKSEQFWSDLPEGYLQGKGSLGSGVSATVQAGFNTFTWGVTDGYNPIDVVSARRYNDPLNSVKLGAFSLLGRLDFGGVLLEGIYIPWQRKSRLPGENSRWLPRELGGPIVYEGLTTDLPANPSFTWGQPIEYDSALKNNIGARVSSHFLGMDAAAYVFDGAATVPSVLYTLVIDATALDNSVFPPRVTRVAARQGITLQPIYNRVTVTGASAVFPVWELLVKGEVAVTKAYRKGSATITEQNTEAVAEVEHTFSGEKSTFTAIGLVTWANPRDNGLATSATPSLTRLFDQALGTGFRWQPSDAVQGEGYAFLDAKHGGSIYNAQLTYKLSDAWKVYGGGQLIQGKSSQPLGVYGHNGRLYAGLKVAL